MCRVPALLILLDARSGRGLGILMPILQKRTLRLREEARWWSQHTVSMLLHG